jgi:AraC family transcriptional regulator
MREFKAVHAISPFEYLQRRRTQTASRLLCSTDLSVAEIAERTGFHVRTLVRRLHRSRGVGARALRTQSQHSTSGRMTTSVASLVTAATSISSVR